MLLQGQQQRGSMGCTQGSDCTPPCSCPLHRRALQLLLQPGLGVALAEQLYRGVEGQREERNGLGAVPLVPEHQPLGKLRQRQQLAGRTSVIMGRFMSCFQQ